MLSFFNGDGSFAEAVQFLEEDIPMGLFSMDYKTKDMSWSAGTFRLLGLDPNTHQPTAAMFEAMVHPANRAAVELTMHNAMPLHLDLQIVNSIGRPRWVRVNAEFLMNALGKPDKMIGSLLDVSAEHEARLFSKAIQRRLDAVRSVCSPIWWIAGADGNVEYIEGWESLTGQTRDESRDGGWRHAVHADDVERVGLSRERSIQAGEPCEIEMRVRRRDGSYRWMNARSTPVRDESGDIAEWIGSLTDIHCSKEWPKSRGEAERLSGAQIRGARAIANWSVKQLAEAAGVPVSTIRRVEEFDGVISSGAAAVERIKRVLEQAGVDFVSPPVGKPAVRPA